MEPRQDRGDAQDEALASFLLDAGFASRGQLAEVQARAQEMGESLAHMLAVLGVLDEDEVRRALAKVLGIPFVALRSEADTENNENTIVPEALACIPEPFSRAHGVVGYALSKERGAQRPVLEVALLDLAALEPLQQLALPYTLRARLTDRASMTRALLLYQHLLKDAFASRASGAALDVLLERALYSTADSVHILPESGGYIARYGLAGGLYDAALLPHEIGQEILARVKEVAQLQEKDGRTPQRGSFKISAEDTEVHIDVFVLPAVGGESLVLQLSRQAGGRVGHTLEAAGLHGNALVQVRRVLHQRRGLVLVAVPESSAAFPRTDTEALLYALLDTVGGYTHKIMTVENQVSVRLPFAMQTEIGNGESGFSMAVGVRAALLHEPDMLLVSDIADRETALLVLEAANRGVFIIAGIKAPGAAAGIEKLRAFGASPRILAHTLRLAMGTNVVRALCAACAPDGERYHLSRSEVATLEENIDFAHVLTALKQERVLGQEVLWRDVSFGGPVGCAECQGGYRGYMPVVEVLPISLVLREAILAGDADGVSAEALEARAREEGMLTCLEDAIYKAATGQTSLEEALSLEA